MEVYPKIDEDNQFAFSLFKKISSNENNIVVCPISLNVILALIYLGAGDETANEIAELLKLKSLVKSETAQRYELFHKLFDNLENISFNIVNKIYIKKDYQLLDKFQNIALECFRTENENIDFSSNQALEKINSWISAKTNQRLQYVVDSICPEDIMLVINTIYFNALWEDEFRINNYPIEFNINENDMVEVPHLFRKDLFQYYYDPEYKVKILEIPYKNEQFSFVIFLPNSINGWKDFEQYLPSIKFQNKLEETLVKVSMPSFKIEQTHDLTTILQELGLKTAFNNCANLMEMARADQEPLKISKIVQKNSIIVSDKGTEASTATPGTIKMKLSASELFNVDHPFFFMIQHKPSNTILYLGRVINPK